MKEKKNKRSKIKRQQNKGRKCCDASLSHNLCKTLGSKMIGEKV